MYVASCRGCSPPPGGPRRAAPPTAPAGSLGTPKVIPTPDFRISPDGKTHWKARGSLATGITGVGISSWLLVALGGQPERTLHLQQHGLRPEPRGQLAALA